MSALQRSVRFVLALSACLSSPLHAAVIEAPVKSGGASIAPASVQGYASSIGKLFSSATPDLMALSPVLSTLKGLDLNDPKTRQALSPVYAAVQDQARALEKMPATPQGAPSDSALASKYVALAMLGKFQLPETQERMAELSRAYHALLPNAEREKIRAKLVMLQMESMVEALGRGRAAEAAGAGVVAAAGDISPTLRDAFLAERKSAGDLEYGTEAYRQVFGFEGVDGFKGRRIHVLMADKEEILWQRFDGVANPRPGGSALFVIETAQGPRDLNINQVNFIFVEDISPTPRNVFLAERKSAGDLEYGTEAYRQVFGVEGADSFKGRRIHVLMADKKKKLWQRFDGVANPRPGGSTLFVIETAQGSRDLNINQVNFIFVEDISPTPRDAFLAERKSAGDLEYGTKVYRQVFGVEGVESFKGRRIHVLMADKEKKLWQRFDGVANPRPGGSALFVIETAQGPRDLNLKDVNFLFVENTRLTRAGQ
jgi:hypothetical protein